MTGTRTLPHLAHWGAVRLTVEGEGDDARVVGVDRHPDDPAPSPLHENFLGDGLRRGRVARPAVRKGWVAVGPGPTPARRAPPCGGGASRTGRAPTPAADPTPTSRSTGTWRSTWPAASSGASVR